MSLNDIEFHEKIIRLRDKVACHLSFQPDLLKSLDRDFTTMLNTELNSAEFHWEKCAAVPDLANQLPRSRGLYMFVWRPAMSFRFEADAVESAHRLTWILYVGKVGIENGVSDTFRRRYKDAYKRHVAKDPTAIFEIPQEKDTRELLLSRYLTLRPLEYWYLPISDISTIVRLEDNLIRLLNPPLNTQKSKKSSRGFLGTPRPAF